MFTFCGRLSTKFGENRWKISSAIVDKSQSFITWEVGRRTRALHNSTLAVNNRDSALFIWGHMFQIWWRSVENWGRYRLLTALCATLTFMGLEHYISWWRSIVVKTAGSAGVLSLSWARLTAGRGPCNHFVGEASAISQPTRPTQPSIPPWSVNE